MARRERAGQIVTFYSYKGGTGRTAALANVAWLLACRGLRTCVVDWDLEAPGLHRYFHPFLIDRELATTDGLIDYLWSLSDTALTSGSSHSPRHDILDYRVRIDWEEFPDDAVLDFIPAGRQSPEYSKRVTTFPWEAFYERMGGGSSIDNMRDRLAVEYDYVLIDSRTGVSDTSGICTMQLPDRLVACYALNRQSIEGVTTVLDSVRRQRPDLKIFPIEMRVEANEKAKLDSARRLARQRFTPYVDDPRAYWEDMEVTYWPFYAFEECLAVFGDDTHERSRSSMLSAMEGVCARVTNLERVAAPVVSDAERSRVLKEYSLGPGEVVVESSEGLRRLISEVETRYALWRESRRRADLLPSKLTVQLELADLPARLDQDPVFHDFLLQSRKAEDRGARSSRLPLLAALVLDLVGLIVLSVLNLTGAISGVLFVSAAAVAGALLVELFVAGALVKDVAAIVTRVMPRRYKSD
jgi:MinD-like ATPase involved in chromosome partitioning or flagellar assembly